MKRTVLELLLLLAIVFAAGTAYTFWTAGNPDLHLAWVSKSLDPGFPSLPVRRAPDLPAPAVAKDGAVPPVGTPSAPAPLEGAPKAAPEAEPGEAATSPPEGATPTDGVPWIDLAATLEHYHSGVAVFVDARRARDYEEGHVTGALHISPWEDDMDTKLSQLKQNPEIVPEAPIVTYCNDSKDCEDSHQLAVQLQRVGFRNVMLYSGGFPQWKKEKPDLVTKGKGPGTK
jgi:rhodanese-related sulfurtransferase